MDNAHEPSPSPSSGSKKAKVDDDAMEEDAAAATSWISVNASATDKQVVTGLHPVLLSLREYDDSSSLCSFLETLGFLNVDSSSAKMQPKDEIMKVLAKIYTHARDHEAGNLATVGKVPPRVRTAAIEIRNAILRTELQNIGDEEYKSSAGMMVYEGFVPDLQNPGTTTRIVIRDEDRRFWNRCIELCLDGHPVCGVGNPGIGKSTTAFFLLQKIVRELHCPVIYTIRKSKETEATTDTFYEIVPVLDNTAQLADLTLTLYNIPSNEKSDRIPSMNNPEAFYVVDPGKFKGSCDDTDDGYEARFLMSASNESDHWGGKNFTKTRKPATQSMVDIVTAKKGGELVYGSLWTGRQVLLAQPHVAPSLTDAELLDRFRMVGGSLRDILYNNNENFVSQVDSALHLDATTVQELVEGSYRFAFDSSSPSSVLIGVRPSDDQRLTNFKILLRSDYVEERLAHKYLRTSWYSVLNEGNVGNRGNLFESHVRRKFSLGPVFFSKEEARESLRTLPAIRKGNEKKNYAPVDNGITVGSARGIVRSANMVVSVREDQTHNHLYYSKNEREPLVDMIFRVDGGFDSIQATISKKHDCETEKIWRLKTELALDDSATLRIFYAVPLCHYAEFVTEGVNPLFSHQDLSNVRIYHVGVSGNDS